MIGKTTHRRLLQLEYSLLLQRYCYLKSAIRYVLAKYLGENRVEARDEANGSPVSFLRRYQLHYRRNANDSVIHNYANYASNARRNPPPFPIFFAYTIIPVIACTFPLRILYSTLQTMGDNVKQLLGSDFVNLKPHRKLQIELLFNIMATLHEDMQALGDNKLTIEAAEKRLQTLSDNLLKLASSHSSEMIEFDIVGVECRQGDETVLINNFPGLIGSSNKSTLANYLKSLALEPLRRLSHCHLEQLFDEAEKRTLFKANECTLNITELELLSRIQADESQESDTDFTDLNHCYQIALSSHHHWHNLFLCQFNQLPKDLRNMFFSKLNLRDKNTALLVCKSWANSIQSSSQLPKQIEKEFGIESSIISAARAPTRVQKYLSRLREHLLRIDGETRSLQKYFQEVFEYWHERLKLDAFDLPWLLFPFAAGKSEAFQRYLASASPEQLAEWLYRGAIVGNLPFIKAVFTQTDIAQHTLDYKFMRYALASGNFELIKAMLDEFVNHYDCLQTHYATFSNDERLNDIACFSGNHSELHPFLKQTTHWSITRKTARSRRYTQWIGRQYDCQRPARYPKGNSTNNSLVPDLNTEITIWESDIVFSDPMMLKRHCINRGSEDPLGWGYNRGRRHTQGLYSTFKHLIFSCDVTMFNLVCERSLSGAAVTHDDFSDLSSHCTMLNQPDLLRQLFHLRRRENVKLMIYEVLTINDIVENANIISLDEIISSKFRNIETDIHNLRFLLDLCLEKIDPLVSELVSKDDFVVRVIEKHRQFIPALAYASNTTVNNPTAFLKDIFINYILPELSDEQLTQLAFLLHESCQENLQNLLNNPNISDQNRDNLRQWAEAERPKATFDAIDLTDGEFNMVVNHCLEFGSVGCMRHLLSMKNSAGEFRFVCTTKHADTAAVNGFLSLVKLFDYECLIRPTPIILHLSTTPTRVKQFFINLDANIMLEKEGDASESPPNSPRR